jgi:hypothetical protein
LGLVLGLLVAFNGGGSVDEVIPPILICILLINVKEELVGGHLIVTLEGLIGEGGLFIVRRLGALVVEDVVHVFLAQEVRWLHWLILVVGYFRDFEGWLAFFLALAFSQASTFGERRGWGRRRVEDLRGRVFGNGFIHANSLLLWALVILLISRWVHAAISHHHEWVELRLLDSMERELSNHYLTCWFGDLRFIFIIVLMVI